MTLLMHWHMTAKTHKYSKSERESQFLLLLIIPTSWKKWQPHATHELTHSNVLISIIL